MAKFILKVIEGGSELKVVWYICIFLGVINLFAVFTHLTNFYLWGIFANGILAVLLGYGGLLKLKELNSKILYVKQLPDRVLSKMKSMGCDPKSVLWTAISAIGIDDIAKKFCVVYMQNNEPVNPKLYHFSDIVKVELVELTDIKNKRNGSFMGGVMGLAVAGPLGMVVGSHLLGSTDTKTVNRGYELKVVVNDLQHPTYSVDFNSKDEANHWYGMFTAVSNRS